MSFHQIQRQQGPPIPQLLAFWTSRGGVLRPYRLRAGLACFAALADAGCRHKLIVFGALKLRAFGWINKALGNLKASLAVAVHPLDYRQRAEHAQNAQHAQRDLAAFA